MHKPLTRFHVSSTLKVLDINSQATGTLLSHREVMDR
jgi:hypothetical protein